MKKSVLLFISAILLILLILNNNQFENYGVLAAETEPIENHEPSDPRNVQGESSSKSDHPAKESMEKILKETTLDSDDDEVPVKAIYTYNEIDDDEAPNKIPDVQPTTISKKDNAGQNKTESIHTSTVSIPKSYLKYKLEPKLVGKNKLLCLNAQDLNFYFNRTLSKPILTLWILTKRVSRLTYASKRFFEEGWNMNIQVIFVQTSSLDMIVTSEGLEHIMYRGKRVRLPDVVFPRLGAAVDYFGMAVIRQLEKNGVLILNPSNSIEISRDKLYSLQHLAAHNLPIPKTMIAKLAPVSETTYTTIQEQFDYPVILKKASGSQGKGVMLIRDRELLSDMLDMLDTTSPLIFQEYISKSKGRDIRVIIVGGKAVGAMMRVANSGFKSNFHQGGYVKRVKMTAAVEWLAVEAARLIGLDIAGVDILIDGDSYKICEVNASPGFEGFELATGVNVPKKILEFIKVRLGVWNRQEKPKRRKPRRMVSLEAEHILRPEKTDL
mmetsp:Transcript_9397/g.13910  ORF Transcript_9397/g.13910 Transcript_9397/m.13910 type:complete len:496 (-) Transcript_9397:59-1546(-)|eukprot:CAMPEP_0117426776 /NCGR_PEP_ID=MMETSP0758-20121206/6798_1 /TAXON_ID=63605 /ORGANISM="Percolomonas cosmopolitus, Strain AE-1 (ATCC 50343)" /LENGTH=495 /DNA_ID=CAMNT_0005212099 /DNA_START=30 /DNA_END=1517 /DNA_ORIENTATION=+